MAEKQFIRLHHRDDRDQKTVIDADPQRLRERVATICRNFPGRYTFAELPRPYAPPDLHWP